MKLNVNIHNAEDVEYQTRQVINSFENLHNSIQRLKEHGFDIDMKVRINSKKLREGAKITTLR